MGVCEDCVGEAVSAGGGRKMEGLGGGEGESGEQGGEGAGSGRGEGEDVAEEGGEVGKEVWGLGGGGGK